MNKKPEPNKKNRKRPTRFGEVLVIVDNFSMRKLRLGTVRKSFWSESGGKSFRAQVDESNFLNNINMGMKGLDS